MDLTAWVDVAIGLVLIYLGASLFVTVFNEYIAQTLNLRGKALCDSLKTLIDDEDVQKLLKQSPAIKRFFDSEPDKAPSYVDPTVLAHLLVGGLVEKSRSGDTVGKQVSNALTQLPDSEVKAQLQALAQTAGESAETLVSTVGDWADRSLTVLGEGYKRNLQKISFAIGFVVAIAFNLDTVALTVHLYQNKDARDAAVAVGVQMAEQTNKETFDKCLKLTSREREKDTSCAPLSGLIEAVRGRNETLGKLPIGWGNRTATPEGTEKKAPLDCWLWLTRGVGWLLTALAISLGASFWFDLLKRLINVRHGMRRPEVKVAKAGQ